MTRRSSSVASAPTHRRPLHGSTARPVEARPNIFRSRITEWACNGLLLIGAVVSTYLVVTQ